MILKVVVPSGTSGRAMKTPAAHVFSALQGSWNIMRQVVHTHGETYAFTGQGTFFATGCNKRSYIEAGTLQTLQGPIQASRRYAYEYDPAQDVIRVVHGHPAAQNAVLHALQFTAHGAMARAQHRHRCGDDLYDVDYALPLRPGSIPWFTTTYAVRGPHKAYTMQSLFTRSC